MAPSATGGEGEALSCPQAVMEKLPESLEGIFPSPQGGRSGDWRTETFSLVLSLCGDKRKNGRGKEKRKASLNTKYTHKPNVDNPTPPFLALSSPTPYDDMISPGHSPHRPPTERNVIMCSALVPPGHTLHLPCTLLGIGT